MQNISHFFSSQLYSKKKIPNSKLLLLLLLFNYKEEKEIAIDDILVFVIKAKFSTKNPKHFLQKKIKNKK